MPISITIVSRYVILSFLILMSGENLRTFISNENIDKSIFIFHVLGLLFFYKYKLVKIADNVWKKELVLSLFAVVILVIGILRENFRIAGNRSGEEVNSLWNGFGIEVLCTLLIFIILYIIYVKTDCNFRISTHLSLIILIGLISMYSLSIWQTKNSLIDFDHSEYILNESLAFSSGHLPYSNFIPQYSMLYNIFLWPLSNIFSVDQQLNFAFVCFFLVSVLTLSMAVYIVNSSFPFRNYLKSFLIVIPLTLVTPGLDREWILGSITSLPSAIPNRIFPAVLLFVIYYTQILKPVSKSGERTKLILIGFLGGNIFWHSQDFGAASIISLILTILITNALNLKQKVNQLLLFAMGILIGISFYPFCLFVFDKSIRFEFLAFFVRQFGSGFGAEPINPIGPIMIILPIIFIVFYFHLEFNKLHEESHKELLNNCFIGIFFSFFLIFTFPYYLNRSIVSGQLQLFLLPISVALGSLIGTLTKLGFFQQLNSYIKNNKISKTLILSPLLIVFLLPISTISLFPNPIIEVPRVLNKVGELSWPPPKLSITLVNIDKAIQYSSDNGVEVSYFGSFSNYIFLKKNIKVVNLYNSAYDFYLSDETRKYGCSYLISMAPQFLILDHSASEIFRVEMDKNKNDKFCGEYKFSSKLNIEPYFFAEKVK